MRCSYRGVGSQRSDPLNNCTPSTEKTTMMNAARPVASSMRGIDSISVVTCTNVRQHRTKPAQHAELKITWRAPAAAFPAAY